MAAKFDTYESPLSSAFTPQPLPMQKASPMTPVSPQPSMFDPKLTMPQQQPQMPRVSSLNPQPQAGGAPARNLNYNMGMGMMSRPTYVPNARDLMNLAYENLPAGFSKDTQLKNAQAAAGLLGGLGVAVKDVGGASAGAQEAANSSARAMADLMRQGDEAAMLPYRQQNTQAQTDTLRDDLRPITPAEARMIRLSDGMNLGLMSRYTSGFTGGLR